MQVEITSKITKRPYLKIMEKIQQKMQILLKNKIGEEYSKHIQFALKDKSIQNELKVLMKQEKIQLHNEQNQPVYQKQISLAAQVEEGSAVSTPQNNAKPQFNKQLSIEVDKVKSDKKQGLLCPDPIKFEEGVSPEMKSKTHLAVKQRDLKEIESQVRNHIKTKQKKSINV